MASKSQSLFDRARRLTASGREADARDAYLALLKIEPDYFGALNNLGALLSETGYAAAARSCYERAVACHPDNPMGHVNLANALRAASELSNARAHAETALRLVPGHKGAHRALADILNDLGDANAAARHRDAGYAGHPAMHLPYRGAGKPVSLLMLVSAAGGNVPIRHLIDDTLFRTTVIYADYWTKALPRHDLVFNAIGDADLCKQAMLAAERLLARTDVAAINPPPLTKLTGRADNAARLGHLAGVRTARTVTLPRATLQAADAAQTLAAHGLTFPFLLRAPGYHTGQHFERVENAAALPSTLQRLPGEELTAMEFLDARGPDGHVRKYRAMFVDGAILPLHLCLSDAWKVHYFSSAMASSEIHRAEEARYLTDMPAVVGARGMAALERIRQTLGLDYGGIDFALDEEGCILVFEANATMVVLRPGAETMWDYRRSAIARVEDAVRALFATRAQRPARAA